MFKGPCVDDDEALKEEGGPPTLLAYTMPAFPSPGPLFGAKDEEEEEEEELLLFSRIWTGGKNVLVALTTDPSRGGWLEAEE